MSDEDRPEIGEKKLDRNWNEMLQELRVAQTGVQILFAFLLTVPFSAGFDDFTQLQRVVYLVVLECAMGSVILLLTPVALHRQLFRRGERLWLVETANNLARLGLVLLAAANGGATWLVVDVVVNRTAAFIVAGPVALLVILLWIALPAWLRRSRAAGDHDVSR